MLDIVIHKQTIKIKQRLIDRNPIRIKNEMLQNIWFKNKKIKKQKQWWLKGIAKWQF